MTDYAYYNEYDPFVAAWLRKLIEAKLIAPGYVDERSIKDVQTDELQGFYQHHFFAGIGVWSYALRRAGWDDQRPVWTGSCPCQPFSAAGSKRGFADDRHLWPEFFRLIRQCRPDVVFGEQVSSPDGLAWFDTVSADLEGTGYACGALDTCAAGVGAPHIRQRLYWMANRCAEGLEVERIKQARREREAAQRGGEANGLGNTRESRSGWNTRAIPGEEREGSGEGGAAWFVGDESFDASAARGMEYANEAGFGGVGSERLPQDGDAPHGADAHRPGPCNGFWGDAIWIPCSDGKARPAEPGTFPLAHGAANRMGRLRGTGNALCEPQAEAFVKAAMGCMP